MPVLVKRISGSSTRLPMMVVWLSAAMTSAPCSRCWWLAFGAESFGAVAGTGGVEGVGHAVVLAGLPDDRVGVVLAAVVDGDADAEGQGGLALGEVVVADGVGAVGGDAEAGVEPVEGLLGGPLGGRVGVVVGGVAVVEVVFQIGVVVEP